MNVCGYTVIFLHDNIQQVASCSVSLYNIIGIESLAFVRTYCSGDITP